MAELRPCVGCGFDIDSEQNLVVAGAQERQWPLGADPEFEFCDVSSGRVWHKPRNLPWGRWWSQSHTEGVVGYPVNGSNVSIPAARAVASRIAETPYCQTESDRDSSDRRCHKVQFEVHMAMPPEFTIAYVRLVRDKTLGGPIISEAVGEWELFGARPFVVATDITYARAVKWRLQAFFYGAGPLFVTRVNGMAEDVGPALPGIAGNYEPGGGAYYG